MSLNSFRCGSCWAFSTVETVESHVAIKTGKLLVMSPQQIVSCAANPSKCGGTGGCEGATQEIGFNYTASAGGLSLDSEYPYWSGLGIDIPCNASLVKPVATVEGYVKLDANNATQLQAAIAQVGPIAISVAASGSFQMYGGGVLNDNGQCGWDVDHAVQAVGYGVDGATGFGYWLVRNRYCVQSIYICHLNNLSFVPRGAGVIPSCPCRTRRALTRSFLVRFCCCASCFFPSPFRPPAGTPAGARAATFASSARPAAPPSSAAPTRRRPTATAAPTARPRSTCAASAQSCPTRPTRTAAASSKARHQI